MVISQPEVALGRAGGVIAVEALPAPKCNLFVPEQLAGGRIGDTNLGAGRGVISQGANGADAQPVMSRQIISQKCQTFLFPIWSRSADYQIQRAIVVDIAEAQT